MWDKALAKLITYGVVLFLKYVSRHVSKNVTELFRILNRARDLQFSLKCASILPPDQFYIYILKILSEERVSIIVVIITWIYHINRARDLRFSLKCASFLPPDHLNIYILKIFSEERVSKIVVIITWIYHFNRARDLRFSLKCESFLPPDQFYIWFF